MNSPENNVFALQASRESLVLLKNNGLLPLSPEKLKKIAIIGPNADETRFALTHYGPLTTDIVSVYRGMKTALEGKAEVSYALGCGLVDKNWPESEIFPEEPDEEKIKKRGKRSIPSRSASGTPPRRRSRRRTRRNCSDGGWYKIGRAHV